MDWSNFPSPRLVELTVFFASICTILLFVGMVIRYTVTFFKESQLPWQAWLAFVLQILIVILVYFYIEPRWLTTPIVWGMVIANELYIRVFMGFIRIRQEIIEGYQGLLFESQKSVQEYRDSIRETIDE